MIERAPDRQRSFFQKGMLVTLRDDLDPVVKNSFKRMLGDATTFRILHVEQNPEYGEIATILPSNVAESSTEDFDPEKSFNDPQLSGVVRILTVNLVTAHN